MGFGLVLQINPMAKLGEAMSRPVVVVNADQRLSEIDIIFVTQSGLAVLDQIRGLGEIDIIFITSLPTARSSNIYDLIPFFTISMV